MTEAGKCTRGRGNFRSFYKNSYKGESRVRLATYLMHVCASLVRHLQASNRRSFCIRGANLAYVNSLLACGSREMLPSPFQRAALEDKESHQMKKKKKGEMRGVI